MRGRCAVRSDDSPGGLQEQDLIDAEFRQLLDRPFRALSFSECETDGYLARPWRIVQHLADNDEMRDRDPGPAIRRLSRNFERASAICAVAACRNDARSGAQSQYVRQVVCVLRRKLRLVDVGNEDDRGSGARDVEVHAGVVAARSAEARTDPGDDPVLFVGEVLAARLGELA